MCNISPQKANGSGDKLVIRDNAKGEHPDSTDVMISGMDTNGPSYSSVQAQGREHSSICHPKNTEFLWKLWYKVNNEALKTLILI